MVDRVLNAPLLTVNKLAQRIQWRNGAMSETTSQCLTARSVSCVFVVKLSFIILFLKTVMKGNVQLLFLCNPKNQAFSWVYTNLLRITQKRTNHRNISLTGTVRCSCKPAKYIQFQRTFTHFVSIFRKIFNKTYLQRSFLERNARFL